MRFGVLGVGTTTPTDKLAVNGNITILSGIGSYFYNADNANHIKALFNGTGDWLGLQGNSTNVFSFADKTANNNSLSAGNILSFNLNGDGSGGNVGIGPSTTSPLATLDVRPNSGTLAVASISGKTSFASLVVDNSGSGDLFAASSSGLNRFVITQNGNVGISITTPLFTEARNYQIRSDYINEVYYGACPSECGFAI